MLPITFLSDYGHEDEFVGVCHGVIHRIAPGAIVIDIAHDLPPHAINPAALALRNALPFVPKGIHMAVVDPEVGTHRRAIALRCYDGHVLVGPDNGLLWLAIEKCGGVQIVVDISQSPYRLDPVSATFHGRDLFSPVAARLALDTPIEHVGSPVAPDTVARLELPRPGITNGEVTARVISLDRYGNAQLNLYADQLNRARIMQGDRVVVECGDRRRPGAFARTFADVEAGETLIFEDSTRMIAIAINRGDAAAELGLAADGEVTLRRSEP